MKPLYWLIIIDLLLILGSIRIIFGRLNIFLKAVLGHVLSDFDDAMVFKKWDKEHDILHKMNILYGAVIVIAGLSFILYYYVL